MNKVVAVLALGLFGLTACSENAPSPADREESTAEVEIVASERKRFIPRVDAFVDGQRHRATTGTYSYSPPSQGGTGGVGSADGALNSAFGTSDWELEAGDVRFTFSGTDVAHSAALDLCPDPTCRRYLDLDRSRGEEEDSWDVQLDEGTYRLIMNLEFGGGDAEYIWTFKVVEGE